MQCITGWSPEKINEDKATPQRGQMSQYNFQTFVALGTDSYFLKTTNVVKTTPT
jgi:hypothetical protein